MKAFRVNSAAARLKQIKLFIIQGALLITVCAGLSGCVTENNPFEDTPGKAAAEALPAIKNANMVDERFELLSLVFRLAGRSEYSDSLTEYQNSLNQEFAVYKIHPAVIYASALPLGYDAVFKFAVHIVKDGENFVFINDIDSLTEDGRWTAKSADDFLPLLNSFYADTEFAVFYQSNISFYEAETRRFAEQTYSGIDLEWFSVHTDPDNLRCIYSPSSSYNNYASTVNGNIVYAAVSGIGEAIIHEFCHSFANPIAYKWYAENTGFKKWCDDTVNPKQLPNYPNGTIIAGEYLTRAYTVLYFAEHGYAPAPLLFNEIEGWFPYIEDVYAMITPYEKTGYKKAVNEEYYYPGLTVNEQAESDREIIENLIGVSFEAEAEQSFTFGSRVIRWSVLSLAEPLPFLYQQTEVGNVFESNTGDVLYVADTEYPAPCLLIDLGETSFRGQDGYRKYSRVQIH